MSIKKFCAWQGCNETIDLSQMYCPKHQIQYEQQNRQNQKNYDNTIRYKRDKKYSDFYKSMEWEHMKLYIKSKYKSLCLWSYFINYEIVATEEVHHIIPIKADFSLRLNEGNLIPLSFTIHKRVEARYKHSKVERISTQEQLRELLKRWNDEMHG